MASSQEITVSYINVLLLGETGVGKSTFINALLNYLTFTKLDDAVRENLKPCVPASFNITDEETYEQKNVVIGEDPNETFTTGQSSTRCCRSYVFPIDDFQSIRIIDTPGVGDTRGTDEDAKNFQDIMSYLSQFEHLNGICLLLKPNEARLTIFFRFCIKELLTHLHRSAVNNILFCFTNARSTFYLPGETAPLLKNLLMELEKSTGLKIPFTKQSIFCFDNESFRFVAAVNQNVHLGYHTKVDFEKSWDRSVKETTRLLETILQCTPHCVKETLSLNEARRLIYELSRPIAETARNIQTNIQVLNEKMDELNKTYLSIDELKQRLRFPVVNLICNNIEHPRTVCTAACCTAYIQVNTNVQTGQTNYNTHYKSHCHPRCYLQGVRHNVAGNSVLKKCEVMNRNGTCTKCGCPWDVHMHITYETTEVTTEKVDEEIKSKLKTEEERIETINSHRTNLERKVDALKEEQLRLTDVCTKLSKFLYKNSITPYNDDLIEYVKLLVRLEKEKNRAGSNNENIISGLQLMIDTYQQQINIYKDMLDSSQTEQLDNTPDVGDIQQLIDDIQKLPYSGISLERQVAMMRQGYHAPENRCEKICPPVRVKSFRQKSILSRRKTAS